MHTDQSTISAPAVATDGATKFDERSHARYAARLGRVVVVLLTVVGTINCVIDPYLRFGTPRVHQLNILKPAAIAQVRMAKAYGVNRRDFRTLLLGNSRVDVGLNPASRQIPVAMSPAYNLGQPGTGTDTALSYLRHAMAHHKPQRLVLGLDFLSYLQPAKRVSPAISVTHYSADYLRLNQTNETIPWWRRKSQPIFDGLMAGLSLSALQDSIGTIGTQSNKNSANIDDQGFNSGEAFRDLIRSEGQASLFAQKNREYVQRNSQRIAPNFSESTEMRAIAEMLELCERERIEVKVFIHAYHVDVLEIIDATGHWTAFEDWKSHLVELCSSHPASLWDFATVSPYTTEEPPDERDRSSVMNWYWESGHYRSTLGDLMLNEMLAGDDQELDRPRVGVLLDFDKLQLHLQSVREGLSKYQANSSGHHRELTKQIEAIVKH